MRVYDFHMHQPYFEYNNQTYEVYFPTPDNPLRPYVWHTGQIKQYDPSKHLVLPAVSPSIIVARSESQCHLLYCGGNTHLDSIKENPYLSDMQELYVVMLYPGMGQQLLSLPMAELQTMSFPLTVAFPKEARQLEQQLGDADSFHDHNVLLRNFLCNTLRKYNPDPLITYLVDVILKQHGNIKISELAQQTGYSDRYLRQYFLQRLGMSLKRFSRIVRFQYAYTLSQECPEFTLSDIAATSGYYDQSHMNQDFKQLTAQIAQNIFLLYK